MKRFVLISLAIAGSGLAQLANVWHIPGNLESGIPSTMRAPLSPGANEEVVFYQGVWKGDGANQTGGTFSYRIDGGAWQSTGLSYHSDAGSNQFWKATVTMPALPGMVIDYYFAPTFDNRTSPTYIHGTNQSTASLATAQASPTTFTLGEGIPVLGVGPLNANYTTTKLFVDEIAGDSIPLDIVFKPGQSNVTAFEVYTNLNRRDRADVDANGDGYPDGISGPDGATIVAGDDSHYFKAHAMNASSPGLYTLTLPAEKTGAYRLTARWKVSGDPDWRWYTNLGANRRDHAITISPKDARDIRLYEINVLNIEATDDSFTNRSTIEDMHNAPGAWHNGNNRWDLDYLKNLGLNWLWFQPIHPAARDGREPFGGWGSGNPPYEPGSPYAVKNFFEVSPIFTRNFSGDPFNNGDLLNQANRDAAMTAWRNFVTAADAKQVGIMLDAPFNHTAFDVELAQAGVDLFQPDGQTWSPTDEIRNREARFFSQSGNYGDRASSAANIAPGPDRFDFGKWQDVKDVFFGRYDALVETDTEPERSSYTNEGDWFDATDSDWTAADFVQGGQPRNVTRRVWQYFARYATHWLEKTRPAGQNRNSATEPGLSTAQRYEWDARGIDGLRCDFGQGLPPQAWEYIINSARSKKWNFVMMSESLDGGAVTYRSNRHFDILNENIVFPLSAATTNSDYRNIFESRRNAYGQGLVLLNNTSHDEKNYTDPWQALIRYAVVSTVDGAPMVFPGQELGISETFGYNHYELNFGKLIPHFKRFNSMQPAWNDTNFGNDQLYPVYAGIGAARGASPALRSSNRWFLDGDGLNNRIHAVAKYETPNASPGVSDVVLAFTNLDRTGNQSDNFRIPSPLAPLLGLKDERTYNVRNIAAYTAQQSNRRDIWLWGSGITGAALKSNGFFVNLYKVPVANSDWIAEPFEAQFLKVYDVTPPPAPSSPAGPNLLAYVVGNTATFTWSPAADPDGGISGYQIQIGTTPSGSDLFNGSSTVPHQTVTGLAFGSTVYARVAQTNNAGITGHYSSASAAIEVLDPAADRDGDGQTNAAEESAGTNPLDPSSVLKATAIARSGNDIIVTISTVAGKTYQLETSTTLAEPWIPVGDPVTAVGASTPFTHANGAGDVRRFYRARVVE